MLDEFYPEGISRFRPPFEDDDELLLDDDLPVEEDEDIEPIEYE